MPYIDDDGKRDLTPHSPAVAGNPGELNYQFTHLIIDYAKAHGLSYRTINDVLGALDGAGQEFYARVAAPYEAVKRRENGDVYPDELLSRPRTMELAGHPDAERFDELSAAWDQEIAEWHASNPK